MYSSHPYQQPTFQQPGPQQPGPYGGGYNQTGPYNPQYGQGNIQGNYGYPQQKPYPGNYGNWYIRTRCKSILLFNWISNNCCLVKDLVDVFAGSGT